jgi:hypothetical protein
MSKRARRHRKAITRKGVHLCSFSPAISTDEKRKIGDEIRSWKLHCGGMACVANNLRSTPDRLYASLSNRHPASSGNIKGVEEEKAVGE